MQIYVCVKHVPDSAASITIIGDTGIDKNIAFLLNPFDEHAVTQAVKIRDMQIKEMKQDAEVIAICLGPENAQATLQSALAMGADKAVLVLTSEDHNSVFTAKVLKAAIDLDKTPDLILTGKESIDTEGMQTMFRLGALFDFPVVNNIVKLDIENSHAIVDHELSGGIVNRYKMSLPCIIGAGRGLNTPKYPTFPDIVKARKKIVKKIELADLDFEPPVSSMTTVKLESLQQKRNPEELKGDAVQAAGQIIQILKQKAKVIS
jgi:electron transfer flavoprotein beta subunit